MPSIQSSSTSRAIAFLLVTVGVLATSTVLLSVFQSNTKSPLRTDEIEPRRLGQEVSNPNDKVYASQRSFFCEIRRKGTLLDGQMILDQCTKPPRNTTEPVMAAIVQNYKHGQVAEQVMSGLAAQAPVLGQVLVYDDSEDEANFKAWESAVSQHKNVVKGAVIKSPNLHEVRNYNKGMEKLFREQPNVKYYSLMQDDDVLLGGDQWAQRAAQLFEDFPKLCVLGGRHLWLNRVSERLSIRHTCHGSPFQFASMVDSAPLIIRRECFEDLGPLDVFDSKPGEVQPAFAGAYSLLSWTRGWQVGAFATNFQRGVGGHGSLRNPEKMKETQSRSRAAIATMFRKYGKVICHYTGRDGSEAG